MRQGSRAPQGDSLSPTRPQHPPPAVEELLQVSLLTIATRSPPNPPTHHQVGKARSHEARQFTIRSKQGKTSASTGRTMSRESTQAPPRPFNEEQNGRDTRQEVGRKLVERRVKVETEDSSQEKKMGIRRKRTNAIKDFILETLNKAKAQGNCLVIHKGTAQLGHSPPKPQHAPPHQPTQPLRPPPQSIGVGRVRQQARGEKGGRVRADSKGSRGSTHLGLPAINPSNKRWVRMARKFEGRKKEDEQEKPVRIPEVIVEESKQDEDEEIAEEIEEEAE